MALKIWVAVKPQAKKEEFVKAPDGSFIASVRAPARQGKANEALIGLVANYFRVPKSSVRIVLGKSARKKLLEIPTRSEL